jgi:hypothetical protein
MSNLPHEFFRVHHRHSYTQYNTNDGFYTRESYQYGRLPPPQWLNKQTFEDHISRAKPAKGLTTPFISMFDSFTRACNLARRLKARGYEDVFIARIEPERLDVITIELRFEGGTVWLPAWMAENGFVLTSTPVVRRVLGVGEGIGQVSEWFAIDYVPAECVRVVEDPAIKTVPAVLSGKR